MLDRHGRRRPDRPLLERLHGGDDEERRYFAYMAFFVFAMLMLVQGGNLLLLLVGWGLVGLASYLLIGFHHERRSAVARGEEGVRDERDRRRRHGARLLPPISQVGSLDYGTSSRAAIGRALRHGVTLVALGLLGGAVAKSAQIPLHTWLPTRWRARPRSPP
jgi:NADH-quinone oxidoreductase subunit L